MSWWQLISVGRSPTRERSGRRSGLHPSSLSRRLTKGEEIEVEVLKIDIEQQRISLRIPMDDTDGSE